MPSAVVADVITKAHKAWLEAPGLRGKPHRDSKFRRIRPDYSTEIPDYPAGWIEQYRECWHLLKEAVGAE